MDFAEGAVLCFNKPYGWTSFDLVRKVRNLLTRQMHLKKLKVGHAGTLDPLATGVLVVCTGSFTKKIDDLQCQEKEYIATIEVGRTTPSFDLEKETDAVYPFEHITREKVMEVIQSFIGESDQIPPVFSAKKMAGKRAYEFAREGESVEMEARKINISEIELLKFELPEIILRIRCSKGTYIRSLARDLGIALESGGCLVGLQRTASGDFRIEDAINMKDFEEYIKSLN
ncbi:MAG: tRNA pseudouridine(55) synthase TruB [Bacteroidales bacterium]|nr:tRNA pseudouridine(55) synthase TruB [Bacteroidales bacterium]